MRRLSALLLAAALGLGCSGHAIDPETLDDGETRISDPTLPPWADPNNPVPPAPNQPVPERPNTPAPGVMPPGSAVRCASEVLAPRVLRRLTNGELETSIRAAFGLDATMWKGPSFVPDPASGDGFTNNTDRLIVGEEYAKRLVEAGKDVAEQVTSPAHLARILPCSAAASDACATTFVDSIGSKLYRRPLLSVERERYLALYRKVKAGGGDFKTWVYWATLALIKSPNTVYRSEMGEPIAGGKFKLSGHETASALAYAYTGGPPTPELLQLAAANRLSTADEVEAAARQLVLQGGQIRPAFRDQVMRFADQWLGLSPLANLAKDAKDFPDFTPEVQDALGEEIRRFIAGVIFEDKGKPSDLLLAPFTYVNQPLSHFYGMAPVAGAAFVRVPRPANTGVGLLSQGAILAIAASNKSTSPTKRGHLVRERLLCTAVPPPPAVVDPLPEPTDAETTRQRYEQIHVKQDACRGCHALMDPIGFGFEHLDAVGRYRAQEGRFPIDDTGSLTKTSMGDVTFKGAKELAEVVARLPEAADCMADFATAHAFGLGHGAAACIARSAADELRAGKLSLLDFWIKMARAESFRVRAP